MAIFICSFSLPKFLRANKKAELLSLTIKNKMESQADMNGEGILSEGYGMIPNTVLFSEILTDKQKLLYCLISSLCAEKGYCRATNEYLGELLNADKGTISKNISRLSEKGFINVAVSQKNGNQRKITLSTNDKTIVKNDQRYSQKGQEGIVKNDNIIIQENNTIEKKENKKRKFGEYVSLTDVEYGKLIGLYGDKVIESFIENLNYWIGEKPTKDRLNRNSYFTLLNRLKRAEGKGEIKKIQQLKQENEKIENLRDNDIYLQNLFKGTKENKSKEKL